MNVIKKVILTATKNVFGNDLVKKQEPSLVVGKEDKTISLLENGILTQLGAGGGSAELPTMLMNNNGYAKIPTQEGVMIVQWGLVTMAADSTTSGSFPTAFASSPKVMIAGHKSNDHPVNVTADWTSTTAFTITISGGVDNENIHWLAIGS